MTNKPASEASSPAPDMDSTTLAAPLPSAQRVSTEASAWRVWWVSLNTSRTELFEDRSKATAKAKETGGCVIPLFNAPQNLAAAPVASDEASKLNYPSPAPEPVAWGIEWSDVGFEFTRDKATADRARKCCAPVEEFYSLPLKDREPGAGGRT